MTVCTYCDREVNEDNRNMHDSCGVIDLSNKLDADDVEWVVNDAAELGVKIGDRFFFLYKGRSLEYKEIHDDGRPMKWRHVGKREFGECCHPWDAIKKVSGEERLPDTYVGFYSEEQSPDFDNPWQEIPIK